MAKIETWFTQDLNTAVKPRSFPGGVFNNDSLGNLIGVEVTKDGEPFELTGSVNGYCVLSNGETIPVAGNRSGNKASIVLPQTAYSVRGVIKITLKLTNGNETTTLLQVVGAVDQSVTGNMVNPGSVVQDWSQQIAAALQELQDAENNFVRVDTDSQGLTEAKKRNGRTNIDAASVSDVDDLKSALNGIARLATAIPSNADLDDYTDAGNYKITTNAIAQTISHMPPGITASSYLYVMQTDVTANLCQILICSKLAECAFIRVYNTSSDAWTQWVGLTNSFLTAEMYNSAAVYAKGDYVIYGVRLYRAKNDISAESWTPSHWEQTNAMQEIVNLSETEGKERSNAIDAFSGLMSGENVLDYSKVTSGRLHVTDGAVVPATNQMISDYIPIKYGMVACRNFTLDSATYGDVYYDINKEVLETVPSTESSDRYAAPRNAAYVRFTIPKTALVSGAETAVVLITSNILEHIEREALAPQQIVSKTKWLAMGDSITFGVYSAVDGGTVKEFVGDGWVQQLAESLGYDLTVMASRGMGYTAAVKGKDPLSGGDRISLDTLLTRTEALTDDFNLITLAFGVNDYNSPSIATLDTIEVGLTNAITRLATKWKNARIVVITPFNCCNTEGCTVQTRWNCDYPRGNPQRTLKDVADRIQECCDTYCVECINCTENFVLNVVNISKELSDNVRLLPDRVHPSLAAHSLIAKSMAHNLIY